MRKENLFTKKKLKSLVAVALVAAMAVPATVNLNKVSADDEAEKVTYDAASTVFDFSSDTDIELNEDCALNEITTDEFGNPSLKLGEIIDYGVGVNLGKIYKGKTELRENLSDALAKTGITFSGYTKAWKDPSTSEEYYRVNNFSSREKAVADYLEKADSKLKEYDRKQVWAYAEKNEGKGVVLSGTGKEGDPFVAVATDASMKITDIILVNAQVAKQDTSGILANVGNFKKNFVNKGAWTTEEVISWSNGLIKSVDDCIKANCLGQTFAELYPEYAVNPGETTPETYTFPYPTWTKGVTVSTWVKVPEGKILTEEAVITSGEGAEATEVAVEVTKQAVSTIFEFTNGDASLHLKTDGTFKFLASTDKSTPAGKNVYEAKFTGENTPGDNAGKWVYVTLTIMNDGVEVYYNGEKAAVKNANAIGSTACSYFNYGTGYAMEDTEARIAECVDGNNYLDILKNFGLSTDYSDFTKYSFRNTADSGVENIMQFLTLSKTEFFVGGGDSSTGAQFDDNCEGMEFGTTSFYDYVMTAEQAKVAFEDVAESHGILTEIPATPTPTVSGEPVSPTPTVSGEPVSPTPTGEAVSPTPSQTPEVEKKVGDADLDGEVTLTDVMVVLRAALGIEGADLEKGTQAFINADVTGNGSIGLDDCLEVLKIAVGIKL